jgi:WD40 repeat protein
MTSPPAVASASFVSHRLLTVCTSKFVLVIDLQPPHLLSQIQHGPFVHATGTPSTLFTVINTDTAPFLPTFLLVYSLDSGTLLKSTEFPSDILGIQLCESLLYISLEGSIAVLTSDALQAVGAIERRSRSGVFEATKTFLAFSDDDRPGFVKLCSVPGYSLIREIECHKDPIRCISLSEDGTLLTTASHKGTLVRTFATDRGARVGEFRRGFRGADVICVSSERRVTVCCTASTLHVFLSEQSHITVALAVPPIVTRVIDSEVVVVTADGLLSIYKIDFMENRVEMLTRHKLLSLSLSDETKKVKRPSAV